MTSCSLLESRDVWAVLVCHSFSACHLITDTATWSCRAAFSEYQSRYFPLFTDSKHYRHSHAVSLRGVTLTCQRREDYNLVIHPPAALTFYALLPKYSDAVFILKKTKKNICDWICAPFTPVFWHLSELHSNSCDRALQVTSLWHTLRNSKRSTVKKINKGCPLPLDLFV